MNRIISAVITITVFFILFPLIGSAQLLPFQSVKLEYDGAGNRIVRKLYDPNEFETKRGDEDQLPEEVHDFMAFPNPAGNSVTIMLSEVDSLTTQLIVFDPLGQQVGQARIPAGEYRTEIDLRGLAPGAYHIQATAGDKRRALHIIHQ